jgi:hypothetical protein
MGKPKIIGYESDPNNWHAPRLPELTFDSEGMSIPWVWHDSQGRPVEVQHYLTPKESHELMIRCGLKPVYAERPFRAVPAFGGWRLYCKWCDTTTLLGGDLLPHDAAEVHMRWVHPEDAKGWDR